ncbi:PQQ-binding-like beta-propeller repeat protein [Plantactinospora sp. GCM10030261]|uniref:outer membrane protein assembly factor BamB family protein n=1 Tax=Plantactinospora sp. GCM10030261 TaxID=3273420 RepID=UPI0036171496
MAKGSGPCVKCWLAFALVAVIILAATGVWNPFPAIMDWANQSRALSDPAPTWQQRVDGTPTSATIAGNAVVIEQRTTIEARSLSTGVQLWQRKADWAAVAGEGSDSVIAVGKLLVKGYELIDPASGAVRRKDTAAEAVWTYRNLLLDARCGKSTECTLTAWDPRGTTPLWSTFVPGINSGLTGDNPKVNGTRRIDTRQVNGDAGGPEFAPPLLGLPVDDRVLVVDSASGRLLQDIKPGQEDRLVVVGGRVLRVQARSQDGTCYFTATATDPATGQQVWRHTGVNLRTADGAGCVQREDPQGGRNVLVGVGPDAREAVLDGYDGRFLWVGAAGEKLLSVDDRYAVARTPDGGSVRARELAAETTRWSREVTKSAGVALTPYAVIVIDEKPDRIIAVDPRDGRELINVRSTAKVLAVGPGGIVIGDGRDVGYLRFGSVGTTAPGPGPDADPDGGAPAGTSGPSCGGPKNEVCR